MRIYLIYRVLSAGPHCVRFPPSDFRLPPSVFQFPPSLPPCPFLLLSQQKRQHHLVEMLILLDIADVAALSDDGHARLLVLGHKPVRRLVENMILFSHHDQAQLFQLPVEEPVQQPEKVLIKAYPLEVFPGSELLGLQPKNAPCLPVVTARQYDPGKQVVHHTVWQEIVQEFSGMHKKPDGKGGPEDSARHHHLADQAGALFVQFLQNNTAQRKRHEMSPVNFQMVNHPDDITSDNIEIIIFVGGFDIFGLPMIAQVDQQQVEKRLKSFYLIFPGTQAAAGAMDKNHPFRLLAQMVNLIV